MDHRSTEIEVARDLALKAMDDGFLKLTSEELADAVVVGKKVAAFYNAILENLKL